MDDGHRAAGGSRSRVLVRVDADPRVLRRVLRERDLRALRLPDGVAARGRRARATRARCSSATSRSSNSSPPAGSRRGRVCRGCGSCTRCPCPLTPAHVRAARQADRRQSETLAPPAPGVAPRAILRRLAASGGRFVVHTPAARDRLARIVPGDLIRTARWPIISAAAPPELATDAPEDLVAVFPGECREGKGLDVLLQALPAVDGLAALDLPSVVTGRRAGARRARGRSADPDGNDVADERRLPGTSAFGHARGAPVPSGRDGERGHLGVAARRARGRACPRSSPVPIAGGLPEGYGGAVVVEPDSAPALAAGMATAIANLDELRRCSPDPGPGLRAASNTRTSSTSRRSSRRVPDATTRPTSSSSVRCAQARRGCRRCSPSTRTSRRRRRRTSSRTTSRRWSSLGERPGPGRGRRSASREPHVRPRTRDRRHRRRVPRAAAVVLRVVRDSCCPPSPVRAGSWRRPRITPCASTRSNGSLPDAQDPVPGARSTRHRPSLLEAGDEPGVTGRRPRWRTRPRCGCATCAPVVPPEARSARPPRPLRGPALPTPRSSNGSRRFLGLEPTAGWMQTRGQRATAGAIVDRQPGRRGRGRPEPVRRDGFSYHDRVRRRQLSRYETAYITTRCMAELKVLGYAFDAGPLRRRLRTSCGADRDARLRRRSADLSAVAGPCDASRPRGPRPRIRQSVATSVRSKKRISAKVPRHFPCCYGSASVLLL